MIKIDIAIDYAIYVAGHATEVIVPALPHIGDTILLSDSSFAKLKTTSAAFMDLEYNTFKVEQIIFVEGFMKPFIKVVQNK